jgi:hypothetical protein
MPGTATPYDFTSRVASSILSFPFLPPPSAFPAEPARRPPATVSTVLVRPPFPFPARSPHASTLSYYSPLARPHLPLRRVACINNDWAARGPVIAPFVYANQGVALRGLPRSGLGFHY